MRTTIKLTNIKAEGKHGANPGEQDLPQLFLIDIKVKLDVGADDLDQTVDYEDLVNLVKNRVNNHSYKLIETMAYKIASDMQQIDKIEKVTVKVHKPSAAEKLSAGDVVAKVKLERQA